MRSLRGSAWCLSIAAAVGVVAGCGGDPSLAPVSGIVKFNGKPKSGLIVNFQPVGTQENRDPGRGPYGPTYYDVRFTLVSDDGRAGAVIGLHRVRIITPWDEPSGGFDPEIGSPDGEPTPATAVAVDPIPPEWNAESDKEFEVTANGTTDANFEI